MKQRNWRLPDGVDELLPPRARALELERRTTSKVRRSNRGQMYAARHVVGLLIAAQSDGLRHADSESLVHS